ncbi:integrase [uncultured Ruminobacter sp.]|uniref:integrase n=1 Tax=uncultured Ruminobacter sp. TaxID=538947 RepID=UPI00261DF33A|nr:integrase [uncultured Ruminobacter sp.]
MKQTEATNAAIHGLDETLVRHWIRKITVHPDWLTIEFKTGDIVEVGKEQE